MRNIIYALLQETPRGAFFSYIYQDREYAFWCSRESLAWPGFGCPRLCSSS